MKGCAMETEKSKNKAIRELVYKNIEDNKGVEYKKKHAAIIEAVKRTVKYIHTNWLIFISASLSISLILLLFTLTR